MGGTPPPTSYKRGMTMTVTTLLSRPSVTTPEPLRAGWSIKHWRGDVYALFFGDEFKGGYTLHNAIIQSRG